MVYIDPRDRLFQIVVIAPIVLAAIFAVLVIIDSPESIDIVAVLLAIVAGLTFAAYLLISFVRERMQESESE